MQQQKRSEALNVICWMFQLWILRVMLFGNVIHTSCENLYYLFKYRKEFWYLMLWMHLEVSCVRYESMPIVNSFSSWSRFHFICFVHQSSKIFKTLWKLNLFANQMRAGCFENDTKKLNVRSWDQYWRKCVKIFKEKHNLKQAKTCDCSKICR